MALDKEGGAVEFEVSIGESFDIDIGPLLYQGFTKARSLGERYASVKLCISRVDCGSVVVICDHPISKRPGEKIHGENDLTGRELEVAQWLVAGKSNPEIAQLLGISRWTAKLHVGNILRKLDVVSRSQIPLALLSRGLLSSIT